jgi:hypothetical protein
MALYGGLRRAIPDTTGLHGTHGACSQAEGRGFETRSPLWREGPAITRFSW